MENGVSISANECAIAANLSDPVESMLKQEYPSNYDFNYEAPPRRKESNTSNAT